MRSFRLISAYLNRNSEYHIIWSEEIRGFELVVSFALIVKYLHPYNPDGFSDSP